MADTAYTIQLEKLTSSEVDALLNQKDKKKGILLPVGSCEQHGPYLPLGCDSVIAKGAAMHLAESLKDNAVYRAFVLPTFYYTPAPGAQYMPGTISVSFDWLGQGLKEIMRGALQTAWDYIAVVNAHAHNHGRVIEAAMAGTGSELGRKVPVVVINIYEYTHLCEGLGLKPGSHAGEFEIALYVYYSGSRPLRKQSKQTVGGRAERPSHIYGLRIEPRSFDGIIADGMPDFDRAIEMSAELGRMLDTEISACLIDNLEKYFACWHTQYDENTS